MTLFEQLVLSMRTAQKEHLHAYANNMDRIDLLKKLIRLEEAVDAHLAAARREPEVRRT